VACLTPTVQGAIDWYKESGASALKPESRSKVLTENQERAIRHIICDKRPEQLKMEFALWGRAGVMQLIERELGLGLSLSVRGVGNYLARWGCRRTYLADYQR
jgi:hypothetical protein